MTANRVYLGLIEGLALIAAVSLGAMGLWISYDVVARYLFAAPTVWAGDLAEYTLLVATFFGGPWLVRHNGHITVEVAIERLPRRTRATLRCIVFALAAIACALFAWFALTKTVQFYDLGRVAPKSWEIPLWLPYASMPLGAALMAVECFRQAWFAPASDAAGEPPVEKMLS